MPHHYDAMHRLAEVPGLGVDSAQQILHQGIRYEERGPAVSVEAKKVRTRKMIRELRTLGYHVELFPAPSTNPA